MPEEKTLTGDQVRKIAEEIRQLKPVYADTVSFYGELFAIQEEAAGQLELTEFAAALNSTQRGREDFSLVTPSKFIFDGGMTEKLLKLICRITIERGTPDLSPSAHALLAALEKGRIDVHALGKYLLNSEEASLRELATTLAVTADFLAFATYHSLRPSLIAFARQAAAQYEIDRFSNKGSCPICGSLPAMARLDKNGSKVLSCSFCWHEWQAPRLACPFCGNLESETLGYFAIENEEEYRIYTCDRCQKYIKTIDSSRLSRALYPPLEYFLTRHLDLKAHERGYWNEITGSVEA